MNASGNKMTYEEMLDMEDRATRKTARSMGWNKIGKGRFATFTLNNFVIEYRKGRGQDRAFQSRFNEDKAGWFLLRRRPDGLLSNLGRHNSVISAQCAALYISDMDAN